MRLLSRPVQRQDVTRACELIDGLRPGAVIADKEYDAATVQQAIRAIGAEPVIPAGSNRSGTLQRHERGRYRERNLVESFLSKPKQLRRVATRYDKLPVNYAGFVQLAAITILLW